MGAQIACDQREQIGGFGPWIMPFGKPVALACRIAIGQQHRQIAFDPHGEWGHHIGAVWVIGDLAKALRLALGAEHAV